MSKSTASRAQAEPPDYDEEDDQGREEIAMLAIADDDRGDGRRLRNIIIAVNVVAWLAIIALAKWLFF